MIDRLQRLYPLCFLLGAVFLLSFGCARHESPIVVDRIGPDGERYLFKRVARHGELDWFHRWTRRAYTRPEPKMLDEAGLAGDTILEQWGEPDWIRIPFRSMLGEDINEWIYEDEEYMFQFADGILVFEGAISDYEYILMQRGYPNKSYTLREDTTTRTDVLIYQRVFWPYMEQYVFNNGKLTQMQEGN